MKFRADIRALIFAGLGDAAFLIFFLVFQGSRCIAQETPAFGTSVSPRVVETTPTMGNLEVPPELDRIQVRFDQPMSQGSWSWCGGGFDYPEITDRPRFIDSHTAELPVKLMPQRTYNVGINCSSARGFRSAAGVAAEPTGLTFRTAAPKGEYPTADANNYKAWKEFQTAFRERYSYYDRTGTDWETVFKQATPDILMAPDANEWAMRVAGLLRPADDPHLYLRLKGGERLSTHSRRGWVNANQQAIRESFRDYREVNPLTAVGRNGDVAYFAVHAWSFEGEQLKEAASALEELMDARVLIVDVRQNGGGGEDQALEIAAYFVEEPRIYEKHRYRDPESTTGWGAIRNRWVRPHATHHFAGRVLLLQGRACLSSNEAFIMMMRQAPNTTTIGITTGGSSANPRRYELANGVTAVIPSWEAMAPDGTVLEGVGIAPDIEVTGEFNSGDPVLAKAMELARQDDRPTSGGM